MNNLIEFIKKDISYHFVLSGASEQIIANCEETLGIKLPNSYVEFLKFSNGALLYESDELFGTDKQNEGIGSLIETRTYKIAEGLPLQLLLFHDNGFECHAFDLSANLTEEQAVVQWDAARHQIVRSYVNLSEWTRNYLVPKWSPHQPA